MTYSQCSWKLARLAHISPDVQTTLLTAITIRPGNAPDDQAEIAVPHLEGNASCLSYLKHYNQKMYLLIIMISKTLFAVGSVRSVKGGTLLYRAPQGPTDKLFC